MEYTKEMCMFLLENPTLIEQMSLTEHVELTVFQGINAGIQRRLERTPWRTRFALVSGDEDDNEDTFFTKFEWPRNDDNTDLVGFRLWENDDNINMYWLSHALGLNNGTLCFDFWAGVKKGKISKYKIKQRMENFYNSNENLKKSGFLYHKRGTIFIPFTVDVPKLKEEYPKMYQCLTPMFTALDAVVKLLPEFNTLVQELYTA